MTLNEINNNICTDLNSLTFSFHPLSLREVLQASALLKQRSNPL